MNDQELETKMRLEALRSFDVHKEKDRFMANLALANVTPPLTTSITRKVAHHSKKGILLGSSLSFLLIACAIGVGLGVGLNGKGTTSAENIYKSIVFTTLTIENPSPSLAPEFNLTIGVDGQVSELTPANAQAKIVYGSNKHVKKDLDAATKDILGLATDTGFLDKAANRENANNIRVFVSGESTDVTKAKTEVASSVKSYLSLNKIYAYVSDQTIGNTELDRLEQLYSIPKEKCLILLKIFELSSSYSKLNLEETVLKYKDKSLTDLNTLISSLSNNSSSIGPVFDYEDLMAEIEAKTNVFKENTSDFHKTWASKIRDFSRSLSSLESEIKRERCKANLSFIDKDIFDSDDLELEDVFDYIHKAFPDIFQKNKHQRPDIKSRGWHDDDDDDDEKNDEFDEFDDDDFDDWWEGTRPGSGGNKTCSKATKARIEALKKQSEELMSVKANIKLMIQDLQNEITALINLHKDELTQQVNDEKQKYDSLHNKYLEDYKDRDDRDEDFYKDFEDYFEDFFEKHSNFNRR